jgi:hypothetical protein
VPVVTIEHLLTALVLLLPNNLKTLLLVPFMLELMVNCILVMEVVGHRMVRILLIMNMIISEMNLPLWDLQEEEKKGD